MTQQASGTFAVTLTPQECGEATLGRMAIDKRFEGDLEGTSKGEMLAAGTAVKSSAGYVALERVTGSLQGRSGTFALQHSGTMNRGAPTLTIGVVPCQQQRAQPVGLRRAAGRELLAGGEQDP